MSESAFGVIHKAEVPKLPKLIKLPKALDQGSKKPPVKFPLSRNRK